MAKTVYIISSSSPNERGWNDKVEVWEDGKKQWEGPGSAAPSRLAYPEYYDARDRGVNAVKDDYAWYKQGGMIDYGRYKFSTSPDYDGSLLVNKGGWVDSRIPNKRQGNENKMNWVYVHEGYPYATRKGYPIDMDTNRGSTGCPTIHPDYVDDFRKHFDFTPKENDEPGERGELIVLHPPAPQGTGDFRAAEDKRIDYATDLVWPGKL